MTILQHPSAKVKLDPYPFAPLPPTVPDAPSEPSPRIAGIVERVRAKFSQPKFTEGEAVRLDRLDALGRLMDAHGEETIINLVRNLAAERRGRNL